MSRTILSVIKIRSRECNRYQRESDYQKLINKIKIKLTYQTGHYLNEWFIKMISLFFHSMMCSLIYEYCKSIFSSYLKNSRYFTPAYSCKNYSWLWKWQNELETLINPYKKEVSTVLLLRKEGFSRPKEKKQSNSSP